MKLTIRQQEAIISLLRERYHEKELKLEEEFNSKNKDQIEADKNRVKELKSIVESLGNQLVEINKELENLTIKVEKFTIGITTKVVNGRTVISGSAIYGGFINQKRILPEFSSSKAERDLLIKSVENEFDVEKFITDYLK